MSESSSSSVGILGVLGVVFIAFKLAHVIDWSWWWVLAPFWMPLAFVLCVLAGIGIVFAVTALFHAWSGRKTLKRMMRSP